MESDRLISSRETPGGSDKSSQPSAFRRPRSGRIWSSLIVAGLSSFSIGYYLTGSYLILLTQLSCPSWNRSIAVYAEALLVGVGGIFGPLRGYAIRRFSSKFVSLLIAFFLALGWGLCGLSVRFCRHGIRTDVFYVIGYGVCLAVANELVYIQAILCTVSRFPSRIGFSSAFPSASVAVGGLALGQWVLRLEGFYIKGLLSSEDIFLLTGLLCVLLNVPTVFCLNWDSAPRQKEDNRKRWKTRDVLRDKRFWLLWWTRFSLLLPGWGLMGHQRDFLETIWRRPHSPIEALSALILGSYTVSRIVWLLSDKMKQVNLWLYGGSLYSVTFAVMPLFMYYTGNWGVYAALVAFTLNTMAFSIPKSLTVAILGEIYKDCELAAHVSGFMSPATGLAGLLGPIIADRLYTASGSYTLFLFISSGVSTSGLITLTIASRLKTYAKKDSRSKENESEISDASV